MRISEVHSSDLSGSVGKNLTANKFWAFTELAKIKNEFDTVYILGSWYGNAGLLLSMDKRFSIDKIINVETNKQMLRTSDKLSQLAGFKNIEPMYKDANRLDYRQLDNNGLVVNFSTTNMSGTDWFNNIPKGTMMLLVGRNNDPGAVNEFKSLKQFIDTYPLGNLLDYSEKEFQDPETEYTSYLVIGLK